MEQIENIEIAKQDFEKADELIEKRKEDFFKFLKKKKDWIVYIILAIIVWISLKIRTSNLSGLRDITTGEWTLGPDLDPFLFLRWAKYIVENGTLFIIDKMRNVPLAETCINDPYNTLCVPINTAGEMKLLSYLIAWLYNILSPLGLVEDITHAGVLYPVIMFGLTIIAFFFLVREIFKDRFKNKQLPNIIALISTFILSVSPTLLHRTIAGIPEKESAAFLFIFSAFYFFLKSWRAKNIKKTSIYGALAGIASVLAALMWGGYTLIFMVLSVSLFVAFLSDQIDKRRFIGYFCWLAVFTPLAIVFSTRYSLLGLTTSSSTGPAYVVLMFALFNLFIYERAPKLKRIVEKYKIPKQLISIIIVLILGVIFAIIVTLAGSENIISQGDEIINRFTSPLGLNRFQLTVAENKQPYFEEWKSSFGPLVGGFPLFFWSFFFGSIYLFYTMIKNFAKKEKILLVTTFIILILGIIFSRYSSGSLLNGNNFISNFFYFGSMILFIIVGGYVFYKYSKSPEKREIMKKIQFTYVVVIILYLISLFAARGAVRLTMVLVPAGTIITGYFCVKSVNIALKAKEDVFKFISWVVVILVILSTIYSAYYFYGTSEATAKQMIPSTYTNQWQKAMEWVRENTAEDAVFGHWWDYGYWLQSLGERATVLDGGNAIIYWNHLMGRLVLTASEAEEGLEFLYTHNTTHFLVDSTDIGKYPAYASIGSNEEYDRVSQISTFFIDESQTQEAADEVIHIYQGTYGLDEDLIWETEEQGKIYFPVEQTAIAGLMIRKDENGDFLQPSVVLFYNNQYVYIPLKYIYANDKLYKFDEGLESGIYLMDGLAVQNGAGVAKMDNGVALYCGERTINSLVVRLFLFEDQEEFGNYKLVHQEDSLIVEEIRANGITDLTDFIYYQGIQGPVKIYEIEYPADIQHNSEWLEQDYPDDALKFA